MSSLDATNLTALPNYDRLKQCVNTYAALPAPEYFPSGMPNVWRLSLYVGDDLRKYDKAARKFVLHPAVTQSDVRPTSIDVPLHCLERDDGWESLQIGVDLIPYDTATDKPILAGEDCSILAYLRDTVTFDTSEVPNRELSHSNVGWPMYITQLYLLCNIFTDPKGMDAYWKIFAPELRNFIQPLGTWRPARLVLADANATSFFVTATESLIGERPGAMPMNDILELDNYFGFGTVPYMTMKLYPRDPALGELVICGNCHKFGVKDEGHGVLPRFKRCGQCQLTWS